MTLNERSSHPHTHAYVVNLHRDSAPAAGRIAGRLEHVASGRVTQFHSSAELIAALLADATRVAAHAEHGT